MQRKFLKWLKQTVVRWTGLPSPLAGVRRDLLMPKYFYHFPLDCDLESHAPVYPPSIKIEGEPLPVPPPECRLNYAVNDDRHYLNWGRSDHDVVMSLVRKHRGIDNDMSILDWGCSSGRVLRHFYQEHQSHGWKLYGIDIQANLVEWMRQNFPREFHVVCGSAFPHLPYRDNSLDVIYAVSVFSHTKYLWDFWLTEFKRVLKPNGLCLLTVQCETAWKYYHENRHVDWVKAGHPQEMLEKPEIDENFFFYGDPFTSQTFYKEETVKQYWGRYLDVVDFVPPPEFSFQNWIVLKNTET